MKISLRAIGAALVLSILCPSSLDAQRGGNEGLLRQRLAAQPEELAPYLDLISFYVNGRRLDDAERTVASALGVVRSARQKAGQAAISSNALTAAGAPVDADESPRVTVLREVEPAYPTEALEQGIGGSVGVELIVGPHGMVTNARVTRSIAALDAAALEAVRQWEFVPHFRDGMPVPVVVKRTITFIPETTVTMPGVSRRGIGVMLAPAARFFNEGSYSLAEFALELLRAAITRERAEPPRDITARTSGVTTTRWPVRGGVDVKLPARTKDLPVVYPAEARQTKTRGIVTFNFVIDPAGKVTELRHVGFATPAFERTAREVIQQWEYAPTIVTGTAIPVAMTVTLVFSPDRPVIEVARVGNGIPEPRKIKDVQPVYPASAQAKRLTGIVILEAIIDHEGKVGDLRVLRSAGDMLDRVALDTVRQWEYEPTLLGGAPVQVLMTITMTFSIN